MDPRQSWRRARRAEIRSKLCYVSDGASVEAIFLSTFVLISQNRTSTAADKRADLDLQINLLTEHELTKLADVVTSIAARLQIEMGDNAEIEEIKQDVAPEAVLDEIDAAGELKPGGANG